MAFGWLSGRFVGAVVDGQLDSKVVVRSIFFVLLLDLAATLLTAIDSVVSAIGGKEWMLDAIAAGVGLGLAIAILQILQRRTQR